LRKSYRYYEERGPLAIDVAKTPAEGLLMLEELAKLHQKVWEERGEAGAFASAEFNQFHRRLIQNHFDSVQLVRVRAGDQVLGLLYSMIADGTLHTYQSGFQYAADNNNARPGLVVTAQTVEYCLANTDLRYFDLMAAGEGRYKSSLSTGGGELAWYTFTAPTVRNKLRDLVRNVGKRLRPPPPPPASEPVGTADTGQSSL
jgi:CelD/BcsL family acetyltransferase involved in cellulose biosynthesis